MVARANAEDGQGARLGRSDPTEWISRAECGRRLGVSAMMVTHYVRGGMPTRAGDLRVPWPAARDWHRQCILPQRSGSWGYRQTTKEEHGQDREQQRQQLHMPTGRADRTTVGSPVPGAAESLAEVVLRKEIALADQQRLKADEMAGRLIDKDETMRFLSDLIIRSRDTFLRIPPEVADRLSALSGLAPDQCAEVVRERVMQALEAMRDWMMAQDA